MKTLEQIQEENRKAIILANNPEAKDYDEALEMELSFGCLVKIKPVLDNANQNIMLDIILEYSINKWGIMLGGDGFQRNQIVKIIGKPLTLDRVLVALNLSQFKIHKKANNKLIIHLNTGFLGQDIYIEWDLTEPTLKEQTEETQRAINKLLTK